MKSLRKPLFAALGALALVGCARSPNPTESPRAATPAPRAQRPATTRPSATAIISTQPQTFEVRILGVDPGAYTHVLFDVPDVTASANGVPLTIDPGEDRVDLTNLGQAWLLGRVTGPAGVSAVDFTVGFDDAGAFESPSEAGRIDARHITVSWEAPIDSLQRNGHAVVVLDLADSLVSSGLGGRTLVPQLKIAY